MHEEETLGQAARGSGLTTIYQPDEIQSQSILESERGKRTGPAIESSHTDGLGPPVLLVPQAPQSHKNKECGPQDDLKGIIESFTWIRQLSLT